MIVRKFKAFLPDRLRFFLPTKRRRSSSSSRDGAFVSISISISHVSSRSGRFRRSSVVRGRMTGKFRENHGQRSIVPGFTSRACVRACTRKRAADPPSAVQCYMKPWRGWQGCNCRPLSVIRARSPTVAVNRKLSQPCLAPPSPSPDRQAARALSHQVLNPCFITCLYWPTSAHTAFPPFPSIVIYPFPLEIPSCLFPRVSFIYLINPQNFCRCKEQIRKKF